jgi:hypothetical protein
MSRSIFGYMILLNKEDADSVASRLIDRCGKGVCKIIDYSDTQSMIYVVDASVTIWNHNDVPIRTLDTAKIMAASEKYGNYVYFNDLRYYFQWALITIKSSRDARAASIDRSAITHTEDDNDTPSDESNETEFKIVRRRKKNNH